MQTLDVLKSVKLSQKYGLKFAAFKIARNWQELQSACKSIGFPLAMKIVSSKISHKTESGGVQINIENLRQARQFFQKMRELKGFQGVIVQEMVKGKEIIIGGKRDVQFGPTVLVGLGGIFVEVFKDFEIGICPISKTRAKEMVSSLKAFPVLKGYRGKKGVNLEKVYTAITQVSKLMVKEKNVLELDLNPLIADPKNVTCVDARIVLK